MTTYRFRNPENRKETHQRVGDANGKKIYRHFSRRLRWEETQIILLEMSLQDSRR